MDNPHPDLEQQIVDHLRNGRKCTALALAKALGFLRKADVNPALWALARRGVIQGWQPPHKSTRVWSLSGDWMSRTDIGKRRHQDHEKTCPDLPPAIPFQYERTPSTHQPPHPLARTWSGAPQAPPQTSFPPGYGFHGPPMAPVPVAPPTSTAPPATSGPPPSRPPPSPHTPSYHAYPFYPYAPFAAPPYAPPAAPQSAGIAYAPQPPRPGPGTDAIAYDAEGLPTLGPSCRPGDCTCAPGFKGADPACDSCR